MYRLLIVDGNNLLFQMYYGMPARIVNEDGRPIQGVLGFIGALLKILRMVEPTHAVVLFDGAYTTPRRGLDPDYKANRKDFSGLPPEETPFSQLPDVQAALKELKIPYAETTTCRADDWIAGYAAAYGRENQVVIVSQDSDLFQLVTDRVQVLHYRGKNTVLWGPEQVQEKLGVTPAQYAACRALEGDPADNISGVPRVGHKTAAALLRQFGDLDTLLEKAEEIPRPAVRAAVLAHRELVLKNYALIRFRSHVPLPYKLEKIPHNAKGFTTGQVLQAVGLR
jgi:DNA polymerase-1